MEEEIGTFSQLKRYFSRDVGFHHVAFFQMPLPSCEPLGLAVK